MSSAMLRLRALLLGVSACALLAPSAAPAAPPESFLGPTRIFFVDADSVLLVRTVEWNSAWVRHQEKLLRNGLRIVYWRDHLPPDMRGVFESLGYPTGRLLLNPVGHTEE